MIICFPTRLPDPEVMPALGEPWLYPAWCLWLSRRYGE
jgi:hypothetical protein